MTATPDRPQTGCVCGADEPCPVICDRHNTISHGYPCGDCQREWRQANPRTAAVIGKGSAAAVAKARREDKANR